LWIIADTSANWDSSDTASASRQAEPVPVFLNTWKLVFRLVEKHYASSPNCVTNGDTFMLALLLL
jgi:hypothetical protein